MKKCDLTNEELIEIIKRAEEKNARIEKKPFTTTPKIDNIVNEARSFFNAFKLTKGQYKVPIKELYKIYSQWRPVPIRKKYFLQELSFIVPILEKRTVCGGKYYKYVKLNKPAWNIKIEAEEKI